MAISNAKKSHRTVEMQLLLASVKLNYISTKSVGLYQGWPDFFTQGPFSVTLNVLGAANSFQT